MMESIPWHKLRNDDLLAVILGRCRELEGKKLTIDDLFSCPERAVLWLRDMSNCPFVDEEPERPVAHVRSIINPELRRLLGTWL